MACRWSRTVVGEPKITGQGELKERTGASERHWQSLSACPARTTRGELIAAESRSQMIFAVRVDTTGSGRLAAIEFGSFLSP